MGAFNTVASVGAVHDAHPRKATRFQGRRRRYPGAGGTGRTGAGRRRVLDHSEALRGHNGWAAELRIPPSVEQCFHYTAAHEVRQSLLDTVRHRCFSKAATPSIYLSCQLYGVVYPTCTPTLCGYVPGEQGRSSKIEAQLSQVPLLHMYRKAMDAVEFFDLHVHDSVAGFRATERVIADNSQRGTPARRLSRQGTVDVEAPAQRIGAPDRRPVVSCSFNPHQCQSKCRLNCSHQRMGFTECRLVNTANICALTTRRVNPRCPTTPPATK